MNSKVITEMADFKKYVARQYEKKTGIRLQGEQLDAFFRSPKNAKQIANSVGGYYRREKVSRTSGNTGKTVKSSAPKNATSGTPKASNAAKAEPSSPARTRPVTSETPNRVTNSQAGEGSASSAPRANSVNRMRRTGQTSYRNRLFGSNFAKGNAVARGLGSLAGLGANFIMLEAANTGIDWIEKIESSNYSPVRPSKDPLVRAKRVAEGLAEFDFEKFKEGVTGNFKGEVPVGYYRRPDGQIALYLGDQRQSLSNSPFYDTISGKLKMPLSFVKDNAIQDPYSKKWYIRPYRREEWMGTNNMFGVPDTIGAMYNNLPMVEVSKKNLIAAGLVQPGNELYDGGELDGVEVVARRPRRPVAPRPKPAPAPAPIQQAPPLQAIPHPGMPNIGMPANLPSLTPAMPANDPVYIHNNQQGMMNPGSTMDWDEMQQIQPIAAKGSYDYFFNQR